MLICFSCNFNKNPKTLLCKLDKITEDIQPGPDILTLKVCRGFDDHPLCCNNHRHGSWPLSDHQL